MQWDYGKIYTKTIRLRARVFYEQIVNEAQPSWLSLVENDYYYFVDTKQVTKESIEKWKKKFLNFYM